MFVLNIIARWSLITFSWSKKSLFIKMLADLPTFTKKTCSRNKIPFSMLSLAALKLSLMKRNITANTWRSICKTKIIENKINVYFNKQLYLKKTFLDHIRISMLKFEERWLCEVFTEDPWAKMSIICQYMYGKIAKATKAWACNNFPFPLSSVSQFALEL